MPRPGCAAGAGCGTCIHTECEVDTDCNAPNRCENGACCVPFSPGAQCSFEPIVSLPCCGNAVCTDGEPFGYCCLPSGESCSGDAECYSGSCTGGTCD